MKPHENPFRVSQLEGLAFRDDRITAEELVIRLGRMKHCASILGPHGSGKSTLLNELRERLGRSGFDVPLIQLRRNFRTPDRAQQQIAASCDNRTILCVDGADLMPRLHWHRLRRRTRSAGGLVITSHDRALLPALHCCSTSPALLRALVTELLGDDALLAGIDVEALFRQFRGNVRDALRHLYDQFGVREHATAAHR